MEYQKIINFLDNVVGARADATILAADRNN